MKGATKAALTGGGEAATKGSTKGGTKAALTGAGEAATKGSSKGGTKAALKDGGEAALCVRARRCLYRAVALCRRPGALCVGARRSVSGPGALALCVSLCQGPRSLCRTPALCMGPALFVSDPGALCALCVGARRSLARVGTRRSLCRGQRSLYWGPGACPALVCVAALSVSGPGTLVALSVSALSVWGPFACVCHSSSHSGPRSAGPSSNPRASRSCACHPCSLWAPAPVRGPPAQISVPPNQPGALPSSRRQPQTLLFGG